MLPNNFPACLQGNPGVPPTPLCLFFQFLLLPKLSLKVRIKAMGKEKPPPSPAPASGTNTNKNTCACVPGAGKHDLKSATYKESSHPDASLVSSATQKAQLRAVWVQNQPAQEGLLATVLALPGHTEGRRYFPYDWWPSPVTVTGPPSEWRGKCLNGEDRKRG